MSLIALFSSLLLQVFLLCRKGETAVTAFTSKPSDPTYAQETLNITLLWNYTLNSAVGFARFENVTGDVDVTIANRFGSESTIVQSGFQERFRADISDTQAWLTIVNVKRSDQGTYQFDMTPRTGAGIKNTVELIVQYAPYITDISNQTFSEGDSVTLSDCATGNPSPNITWSRLSDNSVVTFPLSISRQDEGGYNCIADNGVGSPVSGVAFITVHYKPGNVQLVTNATANKTCHGDTLKFTCSADGKPVVHTYQLFKNEVPLERHSSGMWIKTVSNNGNLPNQTYKCVANNTVGTADSQNVSIFVGVPSSIQMIQNKIVTEGGDLNLSCNASGTPPRSVSWINVSSGQRHNGNVLKLTNINRNQAGDYRCETSNECGNSSEAVNINVQYPPKITSPKADRKKAERGTPIECDAEGNPSPTYVWRNGTGGVVANKKTFTLNYDGNYTCNASNDLGSDTQSIVIEIKGYNIYLEVLVEKLDEVVVDLVSVEPERMVNEFVLEEELDGVVVDLKSEDKDVNSIATKEFIEKFENEVDKLYTNDSRYNRTDVIGLRKGSVIVSFVLYFTTPVTTSEGLAKLKAATDNGTLGPFTVGALKIIQNVNPTSTPPVSPTGSTTAVSPHVTTGPTPSPEPPVVIIIVAVVGGVVVMVVIIAVVAWCVHNKRKCRRKGTKVCNSESDVALEGQVNGGYADSGPPSANGANRTDTSVLLHEQPTAAAPPTYAVVDKKKKKEKKKKADKKEDDNVAKQNVPDYAVVDKSKKKKKKEVVEDAYAQVDMSKKSKKKPKPGEMLYADLGDFQPRDMPAVSTSPAPLPPIKRPPAYEETQYADITQFLTGNATLPDANNSQGTEMTYANTGGNEKPKETANEGGNEEKPKETANMGGNEEKPKETRM